MIKAGTSLLHYRIVDKLGEGGMGAVWKAKDATLDREAKVLASLNHPNIGAIYGFHEANGIRFLAMELIPGEDLAERLKKGSVPGSEAADIARQIAAGLEYAHDRGIVHRDLKPANIKITPDGTVKVLDFGLAKAVVGDPSASGPTSTPTILPTMTSAGTAMGMILGTAAYMSPEQARGKPVDKRADIWAFGVVFFEMLAGRRLFDGETVSDTLAASDPSRDEVWPAFSPDGKQIAFAQSGGQGGIFVVGATGESVRRLTDFGSNPAWSPDGQRLAFSSEEVGSVYSRGDLSTLWTVDVSGGQPVKLDAGDAIQPAWSPSGTRIAFWRNLSGQRDLATIPAAGGPQVPVTNDAAADWGPVWSPDGKHLYFASDRGGSMGIWRIGIDESSGGPTSAPEPVAVGVDVAMDLPHLSADGTSLVFRSSDCSAASDSACRISSTGPCSRFSFRWSCCSFFFC